MFNTQKHDRHPRRTRQEHSARKNSEEFNFRPSVRQWTEQMLTIVMRPKLVTRILTAVTPLANVQSTFTPTVLAGVVVVVAVITVGDTEVPAAVVD